MYSPNLLNSLVDEFKDLTIPTAEQCIKIALIFCKSEKSNSGSQT